MNTLLRLLIITVTMAVLSACAQRAPQLRIEQEAPQAEAAKVWSKFVANTNYPSAPFRIRSSFRFKTPDTSNRATLQAWGNGNDSIRIDITGPFGSVIASLRVENNEFTIYEPDRKLAAVSNTGQDILMRLGLPVPVSVQETIALLRGNYGTLFPHTYETAHLEGENNIAYTFASNARKLSDGTLVLNKQGKPIVWEKTDKKMSITFDDYSGGFPYKIQVLAGKERSATFFIKDRSSPFSPFPQEALELKLPPDTKIQPMASATQ